MKQSRRLGALALIAVLAWAAPVGLLDAAPAADKSNKPGKFKFRKEPKPPKPVEQPLPGSVLTASEMALDCKKMAGRMKIRILENRGVVAAKGPTAAAQSLQSAVVPIFGGTTRGADAAADRSLDFAKLKAMNDILVSKGCPHYNLDVELAKDQKAPSPSLVKTAGSKAGAKKDKSAKKPAKNKDTTTGPPKT